MVDHLPNFLQYTYLAFRNQVSQKGINDLVAITFGTLKYYFNWSVAGINSILGVIFIKNYEQIAKLLSRKKENKASIWLINPHDLQFSHIFNPKRLNFFSNLVMVIGTPLKKYISLL